MKALISELNRLIALPASDPSSEAEVYTIWALVILAHCIGIIVTGKSVKSTMAYSIPKALIISLLNLGAMLVALACVHLYILPFISVSLLRGIAPALMLIAAIVGVAAIACKLIHRTNFNKALVTLLIAVICGVGSAYITRACFEGARHGADSAIKMKSKTERASEINM